MAYKIEFVDLDEVRTRAIIPATRNANVATVKVIKLPTNAVIGLHFGDGGDYWPLRNQGTQFKFCPIETGGVYVTNPAGADTVELGITYD